MPFDVRTLSREDYWRELCPKVSLSASPFSENVESYLIGAEPARSALASIPVDGYAQLPPLVEPAEAAHIADLIQAVTARGLPAPFAFVYDPIWRVFQRLTPVMECFLGPDLSLVPDDFWVWQVDGRHESKGWGWHRDRWRGHGQFDANGRPLILTAWIPFTESALDNGCIELLPLPHDPDVPDDLERQAVDRESEQFVRPLPVPCGAPLVWNMHVLHRGRRYARTLDRRASARGSTYRARTAACSSIVRSELALSFRSRTGWA
jgi:hypothetical protein